MALYANLKKGDALELVLTTQTAEDLPMLKIYMRAID